MLAAAHLFCGILIGFVFLGITGDRRAIVVGIAGSLLPDLVDKPLALIVPALSSGRTLSHTLLFGVVLCFIAFLIFRYWHTLLGLAFICGVFSHQICDAMWASQQIWRFPFSGPFPLLPVPDYSGYFFWLESSTISEWIFLAAGIVILAIMTGMTGSGSWLSSIAAAALAAMGGSFIIAGLFAAGGSIYAPTYDAQTSLMAGILALTGIMVLLLPARITRIAEGCEEPSI